MDRSTQSEAARAEGNVSYKAGRLDEAITLYRKAHDLDPQQAAPLSNLAAAYFERGSYTESNDYADKALELLQDDTTAGKSRARLLLRKTKALILLKQYSAALAITRGSVPQDLSNEPEWQRLAKLLSEGKYTEHDATVTRLAVSPFKPMVGDFSHTEVVGDDKPASLFDTSLIQQGRKDASFLFINPGDARNVFATLLHLAHPAINTGSMRFLFTLSDINPYNSARLLVVMSMLGQLKEASINARSSKLLAALFYTYISPTMPTDLYDILQQHIQAVHQALEDDDLPDYLGVEPERAEAISAILGFWSSQAQQMFPPERVKELLDDDLVSAVSANLEFFPAGLRKEAKLFRKTCELRSGLAGVISESSSLPSSDGVATDRWKTNVTLIADTPSKLQGFVFDPFNFGSQVAATEVTDETTLADLVDSWFTNIARALRVLQDKIVLTLRGLPASLPYHNHGLSHPTNSQRLYDRIHLSSLPDLVGGTLYVYTFAVTQLQPGSSSYITWKCSNYAAKFSSWNDYDLEFLAFANDKKGETARQLFAVRPDHEVYSQEATSYLFDSTSISGYRRARLATNKLRHEELIPREQLTAWLYRILLKTALPYVTTDAVDEDVLSPFNNSVFITLLERLVSIGYPAHWLSDILGEILSGAIRTTARPPSSRPLKVKEVDAKLTDRTQDIAFLSTELANLSTSISSFGLVHEQIPRLSDLQVTSVKLQGLKVDDSISSTYTLLLKPGPTPTEPLDTALQSLSLVKRRVAELPGTHIVSAFSLTPSESTATFYWSSTIATASAYTVSLQQVESWSGHAAGLLSNGL